MELAPIQENCLQLALALPAQDEEVFEIEDFLFKYSDFFKGINDLYIVEPFPLAVCYL